MVARTARAFALVGDNRDPAAVPFGRLAPPEARELRAQLVGAEPRARTRVVRPAVERAVRIERPHDLDARHRVARCPGWIGSGCETGHDPGVSAGVHE